MLLQYVHHIHPLTSFFFAKRQSGRRQQRKALPELRLYVAGRKETIPHHEDISTFIAMRSSEDNSRRSSRSRTRTGVSARGAKKKHATWAIDLVLFSAYCWITIPVAAYVPNLSHISSKHLSLRNQPRRTRLPAQQMKPINGERLGETDNPITPDDEAFYVYGIQPKTMPLSRSFEFYVHFVLKRMHENRKKKQLEKKFRRGWRFWKKLPPVKPDGTPRTTVWDTIKILNHQRRNVVKLAGYNAPLVVPSFVCLFLGALLMSVIPHFYSECITCVATNEPSRMKCIQALSGLAISSTLSALFTGLRGSLFWIAGEFAFFMYAFANYRQLLCCYLRSMFRFSSKL